jgi:2,4-dienoyl-CoA reductase (NADPH2)
MKKEVSIPLITTNRINTPEVAENILATGQADMVSMARPFLADADFVNKAAENKSDEINTCIGCNQACLDHVFKQKRASCLVNPFACYETELTLNKLDKNQKSKKIAVIGAGPAGLAFSVYAARRGHKVELFDKISEIGGQFNVAKQIPGKEEFYETIRYFNKQLVLLDVPVHLNSEQSSDKLLAAGFDEVILATGIKPRKLNIEGIDHPKVLSYLQVLRDKVDVGENVAIIGAGGIGFDVATYLAEKGESLTTDLDAWLKNWGVDKTYQQSGALLEKKPAKPSVPKRQITLLQRKATKMGKGLGKTSGWVHRANLVKHGVKMIPGVSYKSITDNGLLIEIDGKEQLLAVDSVIICAGQESNRELQQALENGGMSVHLIGGANVATELDAKRAIRQAAELAVVI